PCAGTGAVFLGMASLSSVSKRDLTGIGKFLFVGALLLLGGGSANFLLRSGPVMLALCVWSIGNFSGFIVMDLMRVEDGYETNYISATLGVYLSIYNVFQSLLAILGLTAGDD